VLNYQLIHPEVEHKGGSAKILSGKIAKTDTIFAQESAGSEDIFAFEADAPANPLLMNRAKDTFRSRRVP
jgi:hypothetical protein